jgi:hypothetical protein
MHESLKPSCLEHILQLQASISKSLWIYRSYSEWLILVKMRMHGSVRLEVIGRHRGDHGHKAHVVRQIQSKVGEQQYPNSNFRLSTPHSIYHCHILSVNAPSIPLGVRLY